MVIYFLTGLCFGGLGLAAFLQNRQAGNFPLRDELPYLAYFGFVYGITSWIEMFIASGSTQAYLEIFRILLIIGRPITGLLLLRFGWEIFRGLAPLPPWIIFVPGILIIPLAYVITFASTTFVTPSPIEIPLDIWSRYLLYLPGSMLAGIGFMRHWNLQRKTGPNIVARLMLGAGIGFLLEAFVVGLIVPAAPYGPASYYNYDRVLHNAFIGEASNQFQIFGLTRWLDYEQVLSVTGLPIEFWRLLSALIVAYFVIRGLDVFEEIRKRDEQRLKNERDLAQQAVVETEIQARENAERWTEVLVNINQQIANLENLDPILLNIMQNSRELLRSDVVCLAIWDQEKYELLLKGYSSKHNKEIFTSIAPVEAPVLLEAFNLSQAKITSLHSDNDQFTCMDFFVDKPINQLGVVPVKLVDNSTMGILWMARSGQSVFTETDLIWLECMADQVMIAIQHGIMTGQLQSLSIVEERSRIAREMHDGLAQVLGYLNLQVQTIEALYIQKKQKEVKKELTHMRTSIKNAQADIRENILSLRTTLANNIGLITSIEEYLKEFSLQTGIETVYNQTINTKMRLASLCEVQLVCILQEALSNVRKHAEATRVEINLLEILEGSHNRIVLEVIDNGVGFKKEEKRRSFGLKTMIERAEIVDAEFQIQSSAGQGTKVICNFPCVEQEVELPLSKIFD